MQYFLLLVATCQGLAQMVPEGPWPPKPILVGLTPLDPPGLQVDWVPINDVPGIEAIKGYKILVWELPPVKVANLQRVHGVERLVIGFRPPKLSDAGTLSEEAARMIVLPDPVIYTVQVPNIKLNSIYEVRVRAFTESTDGPLSNHLSIQLLDKKHAFSKA